MIRLRASGLGRRFGARWAVRGLDLELRAGEVAALLGPNGAGKSTTLALLGGFLRPHEGAVVREARSVGALVQDAPLPSDRAILGTLRRHARLLGLPPEAGREALARFGLEPEADRRPEALSHGQRKRAGLALATLGDPELLLLDEPTDGLDPIEAERVLGLLAEARSRGAAVLAATNRVDEIEAVADRAVLLRAGRPAAAGTVAELAGTRGLRAAFLEATRA